MDESLVVFTADHGESLGEHDYWFCHGEHVHRDVVRVPLVLRLPAGRERRSERIPDLVSHLDLWPTVLEALGLEGPGNRGSSLLRDLPADRLAVQTFMPPKSPARSIGITDGARRLVLRKDRDPLLYAYRDDPDETRDLAAAEADRVRALIERYTAYAAEDLSVGVEVRRERSEAERRGLRALGYAGEEE
jgi:arylsulfatase A-like enzyme